MLLHSSRDRFERNECDVRVDITLGILRADLLRQENRVDWLGVLQQDFRGRVVLLLGGEADDERRTDRGRGDSGDEPPPSPKRLEIVGNLLRRHDVGTTGSDRYRFSGQS